MNELDPTANTIAVLIGKRARSLRLADGSLRAVQRRAGQRRARHRASAGATGVALLGGAIGVVQLRSDHSTRPVTSITTAEPVLTTMISVPSVPCTRCVLPTAEKTQLSEDPLTFGWSGLDVLALQTRLKELAFDPGLADGNFGVSTRQAVWAFETLVLGTPLAEVTGEVTNEMWQIMQDPIVIAPRRTTAMTETQRPTHVEIYLDQQVLIVFTDDKPMLITHISSGSNETWCEIVTYNIDAKAAPLPEPRTVDECGEGNTPAGVFWFYLRYDGDRLGPLGEMWNPVFFNYGIAVHGSDDVPLLPTSHGGVRIPMFIADYFPSLVEIEDRVYVWDGVKEPEEYSRSEKLAPADYPNPNATTSTAG